jgi:DNA-binding MarR family transcriptional regulator
MDESRTGIVEKQGAGDVSVEELGVELRGAVSRLYRRLRAEKADDQLGDTHSSVLALLVKQGPHTLRQLSDHEHVTPPSMNQTVNTLAAHGYLVREHDPTDGRKVLLVATSEGIALAAETRRRRHTWLNSQLQELSPTALRTLLEAARILRQVADA